MKRGFVTLCFAAWAPFAGAQDSTAQAAWKNSMVGNLNFTQNHFDNWSQGGSDAWSWQADLLPKFVYEGPRLQWTNTGKVSYGRSKVADFGARKAADELRLESVLTVKLGVFVNPYVSFTGITQMDRGFDYGKEPAVEVAGFLDPGYFTEGAGVGIQPDPRIKTRLGAALKQTVTRNHPVPYADDPETAEEEKVKFEPGAVSVTDFELKLHSNILLTSKVELFTNFKGWKAVDVNWDTMFSSKISKLVSVSLNVRVFYDRDISVRRQLKQVLAVGISTVLI
jgi:hypothetical protein